MADTSITREERYLEYLTGDRKGNVPKPVTRRERYLYELCLKGIGGEISPEEIKNAVNEYLEKNPVKPGATTEQAAQIEQNKKDVASLKEDISTKITKFYASSQGETHLADSDNGKIMDMMLYGKSEQKQYSGKNLLNPTLGTTTQNGVTCTNNGDGTYTLDGTANANAVFNLGSVTFTGDTKYKICGCPQGGGATERYHIEPHGSTNEQRDIGNGIIYSLPNDETKSIYIVVTIGFRVNNLLFKPMLTTDLTATYDDFEPYTGGIPSPNPDYPQEIKSVVNPKVVVYGKNIVKKVTVLDEPQQYEVPLYIVADLRPSTTYVLSFECAPGYSGYINETLFEQITFVGTGNRQSVVCKTKSVLQSSQLSAQGWIIVKNFTGNTIVPKFTNVMLEWISASIAYEPYHEQTITLPYTLNAIPVSSGGNVTIDGKQYIADYVNVERGKLVRMVDSSKLDNTQSIVDKTEWLLAEPQETDLTKEEIATFKALATYYPTTNISVNSEQLDGYTVFNYPIPFEDEWIKTKKDVDSLKARLNDIVGYDNAAAHNAIYRGKNLGTQFTAEMSANIKNGTFKDLYCGDYLVINGTTYRFMDLDYLYKTGDTSLEVHHILVVPDAPMYNHVINDTDTTKGGYVGSKMYTSGLDQALAKIKADFGEAHIVTYRNLLVNAVSNGIPSSWAWYSRQIDLMNEEMVYGTRAWSQASQNGYDTGSNKSQLAAFKHNHSLISSCRSWYWLRAVRSSVDFCDVGSSGVADNSNVSYAGGVRPCFLVS